jgi:hypothetical protein
MITQETIVALASPSGAGAIAVIRLSGTGALTIAEQVFQSVSEKSLSKQKTHTIHLGHILMKGKFLTKYYSLYSRIHIHTLAKMLLKYLVTAQLIFSSKLFNYYCEKAAEWRKQENLL